MAMLHLWVKLILVAVLAVLVATSDVENTTTPEIFPSVSDLPFTNATNNTNEVINLSQTVIFEVGVLEDDTYGRNETAVNSTIDRLIGKHNSSDSEH